MLDGSCDCIRREGQSFPDCKYGPDFPYDNTRLNCELNELIEDLKSIEINTRINT